MRVLIDECLPRRLAGRTNGSLLDLAAREFDAFVTIDRTLEYQQRLEGRDIGIVVLVASSNRLESLMPLVPDILSALDAVQPGEVVRIGT